MTTLKIGSCSWRFDSWQGLVYTKGAKAHSLEEYSRHFNTVEIDRWFWSLHGKDKVTLPKTQLVNEYAHAVPEDFRFSVKVPNSISLTHFYRKQKTTPLQTNPHFLSLDLFRTFLESLDPMRSRLGPLIFQFEYLNAKKMPSQQSFQEQFGEFISQCPSGYTYSLEIRNSQWLNRSYFSFLKHSGLHHVFLQGYYMPPMFPIYEHVADWLDELVVIRLQGPDRQGIEKMSHGKWNRVLESKDREIPSLVNVLRNLRTRHVAVYLNINNHYEGSAPLTIKKIRRLLAEQGDEEQKKALDRSIAAESGTQIELF